MKDKKISQSCRKHATNCLNISFIAMEDICCRRAVSSRLVRCSSCIEFPLIASVCSIALGYTYKRWGGKRLPILRFRQFPRPTICTAINGCCYCNVQEGAYVSFVYIMLISILRLHSIFAFERRTQWAKRKYLGRLNSLCVLIHVQDTLKHHIKMLYFFLAFTVAHISLSSLSLWIPALFSFHCPCTD